MTHECLLLPTFSPTNCAGPTVVNPNRARTFPDVAQRDAGSCQDGPHDSTCSPAYAGNCTDGGTEYKPPSTDYQVLLHGGIFHPESLVLSSSAQIRRWSVGISEGKVHPGKFEGDGRIVVKIARNVRSGQFFKRLSKYFGSDLRCDTVCSLCRLYFWRCGCWVCRCN